LQRKDLNAIEKALSFKRYLDEHRCTQEDLARRLKIDRSTIANLVRLLELPEDVRAAVARGDVSSGHARALLPLGDDRAQSLLCKQIKEEGWSVREIERIVKERIQQEDAEPLASETPARNARRPGADQVATLEQELRVATGTRVDIRQTGKSKGRIVVHFANHDEFERLRSMLLGRPGESGSKRKAG
jgi:ParB family chromosome partitioning protein